MTATTRRKNICMSDADKTPWDLSVAITATEYIDKPNNNGTSWNKATSNAEAVDAMDSINGSSNNGVSQNLADLAAERTTKENNGTAVEDADRNNETNNDNIFWSCTKDNDSIHTPTQKSDNDQENPITNVTVPRCATPPPPHQLNISIFTTQNTHGLRRRPCDADGKPMIHEPHNYTRYEHLVASMKTKSLDVYFLQETWLEGDAFDNVINGYHILRHNGGKGNHNFCGIAIILSPRYYNGWENASARPPITTNVAGEFAGCYISINVSLKSYSKLGNQVHGKKGDKHLALTLASDYHPCTKTGSEDIYARFLDTLDTLLSKLPPNNKIIMGADVNANIGRLDELQTS